MANRFIGPLYDIGAGITPSDGAQLFFSDTGLSFDASPKDTYTDRTKAVANANPVIADAAGVFPEIWIEGEYRAVLKDKNDVQQWQADDVTDIISSTTVTNITALKALTGQADNESIIVLGHTTEGDGGGDIFYFDASSTDADDNGVTIQPDVGAGRWIRNFDVMSFKKFGADPSNTLGASTAINAAIDYVVALGSANGSCGTIEGGFGDVYNIDAPITGLINAAGSNIEGLTLNGNWCQFDGDGLNDIILQVGRDTGGEDLSSRMERIVIEKLRIAGSGDSSADTNQTAIKVLSALGVVMRDLYIDNIGGDAVIIDKPVLAIDGKAFSNGIVLDSVRIRFVGRRVLVVGEGVVTDDLCIIGNCMFNNGGSSLTADSAGDEGGVQIATQTLMWYGGEVSGFGNDAGTFGYQNTVYLRSCAGTMSGVHFELNGVRTTNGFFDLFLDTDCHGMHVSGCEFNESVNTNVQFGIKTTSDDCSIIGMQFVGSRVPEVLVQLNNSNNSYVSGINSSVAPATARINRNDAAKTCLIYDAGELFLPSKNLQTEGGHIGTFTMNATSSLNVGNSLVTANSVITPTPSNQSAAVLQGSLLHVGVVSKTVGVAADISGATEANPCVITTSSSHGFSTGHNVGISGVQGMTELNGIVFAVTVLTATTFELDGIDSTSFTTYITGGRASSTYFTVQTADTNNAVGGEEFGYTLFNP